MILGFLGKGGSGKSSVSTQMTFFLHGIGRNVLAIDADHNMDLSFNLSAGKIPEEIPYLGSSLEKIRDFVGLEKEHKYNEVFSVDKADLTFSFGIYQDDFTKNHCLKIKERMYLISSGPQTKEVLYGKTCSHILTTPLKIYLPLLKLEKEDSVVIDEKAGADGVTTGIVTGLDVGVIVCEPAVHSLKTAKQIAELLDFYQTPYLFAGNKVKSDGDKKLIAESLGSEVIAYFSDNDLIKRNPSEFFTDWQKSLEEIHHKAKSLNKNNRLERTKMKFQRNQEFSLV